MLGLALVSFALMLVDGRTYLLDDVRSGITVLVTPVVVLSDLPSRGARGIDEVVRSRDGMHQQIASLETELLLLKAKTARMAALTVENNRLRDLFGSSVKLQDNVAVAELIGVDPNPEKQEVIIDRGTLDNVFVGQPLLDAMGLMGQVIEVSRYSSRVLLISDESHSVPVQVVRSNLRLIAQGTGVAGSLDLKHVQNTADIQPGDLLISSGLGGRFPVGYPVGVVSKVEHISGQPFAEVTAVPSALLDRSRHVLLVFTEDRLASPSQTSRNGTGG